MAEPKQDEVLQNALGRAVNENPANIECAVCLQTCVHPAQLPCGHIFCFLCIKGIVNQGRRCAMCRQDIPVDYLEKPRLLKPLDIENNCQGFEDGHVWFYEGHNGWWQYDERNSLELESAYQKGERCCELLIAGYLYVADFDTMLQYRSNDPCRRRRIKRDLATITKKGVAGLKSMKDFNSTPPSASDLVSNTLVPNLESLHISHQSPVDHGNESRVRRLSCPNLNTSSQEQPETTVNERTSRINSLFPVAGHSSRGNTQNDLDSNTDSENTNLLLDSLVSCAMDRTFGQTESPNSENSLGYENLLRQIGNSRVLNEIVDIIGPSAASNIFKQQAVPRIPNSSPGNKALLKYLPRNYPRENNSSDSE